MKRPILPILLAMTLQGCSTTTVLAPPVEPVVDSRIASFSGDSHAELRTQWQPLIIHKSKKPTRYRLVRQQGKTVLHAKAIAASSGLMQKVDIDVLEQPWLSWAWRVDSLIQSADNRERAFEDSPVRIVLAFSGDKDSLPFADQILFETARVMTGNEMPYATLMYIWENKAPVGTVIHSSRTGRVRMLVAASGEDGLGRWRNFSRDVAADYQHAFGEKPGKLVAIGVLTDTDNTGETTEAWYGDLTLQEQRR